MTRATPDQTPAKPASRPTLALCIPAYNASAYLPRLLKAATSQEGPAFDEIYVYDDCSKDDTVAVARGFGVTVIEGTTNSGCSFAKNRMAERATADWIHFIDADDLLLTNYTRLAHKWMSMPNPPDVVLFNYEWRDNDTQELLQVRNFDDECLRTDPLRYAIQEPINNFNIYQRRRFMEAGGFDDDRSVSNNEDQAMHIRIAAAGLSFRAEPEVAAISYRVKNSMTSNRAAVVRAQFLVMQKAARSLPSKYHDEIAERLWRNAGLAAACSEWQTAKQSVLLAMELGARVPRTGSRSFRLLAGISPTGAVRLREFLIRTLKPQLRPSPQ